MATLAEVERLAEELGPGFELVGFEAGDDLLLPSGLEFVEVGLQFLWRADLACGAEGLRLGEEVGGDFASWRCWVSVSLSEAAMSERDRWS